MLKSLLKRYKWLIAFASLTSTVSAVAGLVLMRWVKQDASDGWKSEFVGNLTMYGAGILGLFVTGVMAQHLLTVLSTSLVRKLRTRIVKSVFATDYEQIEDLGGHRIYATLTADINRISNALSVLPLFVFNGTTIVLCLAYLAHLSVNYFLMLVATLTTSVIIGSLLMKKAIHYMHKIREQYDDLFSSFRGVIDGGKELALKPARRRFYYWNVVEPIADKVRKTEVIGRLYTNFTQNWAHSMLFVALAGVLATSHYYGAARPDVVVGYVLILTYMIGPVKFVADVVQPISRGAVSSKKIENLKLNQQADSVAQFDRQALGLPDPAEMNKLTLRSVWYEYEREGEEGFSLGPVDLTLRRGELAFLTGGNGSGKTTFAKLLTGLYRVDQGDVEVDGVKVTEDNREWYRSHFSAVFSEFYAFPHVLDHGGNLARDEDVQFYLNKLSLEDVVSVSDGVLSTTRVSQGQRKRLALLQAYVEGSPVCVFDEIAADQDPEFREYFYRDLLFDLRDQNRLVVVITHDDRYFGIADRLIRFEYGKVTELDPGSSAAEKMRVAGV